MIEMFLPATTGVCFSRQPLACVSPGHHWCVFLPATRLRGDQIEVFKILNGYENIDRNMFFSLKKDSRTRGHEVKLVKDQCRLDIRKRSFSQRTINEWNKLSTYCVTASSVNMFKNKVDTYLRRAGYK